MKHKLSTVIFVFVVMSLVFTLTFSAVSQEKKIVLGTSIITRRITNS